MAEQKSAEDLAKSQKEIGVAEFFARNRHLLGFDNKRKALLTTVKEAVDNSLDACEEARILPEILVELIDMGNDRYRVIIEDNGPGIVKAQIPKIFAKLLYGSKFHKLSQSRGQQGIGISASVMYGQLTTGRASKITSKTKSNKNAHYYELKLDTKTNKPDILKEEILDTWHKEHGTRIEIDLEGSYYKGAQSVDVYLKETSIVNPHATIIYTTPKAEQFIFPRVTEEMPKAAEEIKPHPYGVELGMLMDMLQVTEARSLQSFLTNEFSRVSSNTAKEICENARLLPNSKPNTLGVKEVEQLIHGIKKTKIIAPSAECISPIGSHLLEYGLKKEIKAEYYCAITRSPSVYRGNPFIIECALAYGGDQQGANLMRFANRVPLLYQQGACAMFKATSSNNWRSYGLSQSENSLPNAPLTIVVHIASVWVPYTSESKEAIAHYNEIIKEIKLALQELGRKLASYVRKKKRIGEESKKRSYIEKYLPHLSDALINLLEMSATEKERITIKLQELLEKERGTIQTISDSNEEYDESFASIGKEDDNSEDYDESEEE